MIENSGNSSKNIEEIAMKKLSAIGLKALKNFRKSERPYPIIIKNFLSDNSKD